MPGIFILTISFSVLEFRYKYSDFEQVKETIVGRIKDNFENLEQNVHNLMKENSSLSQVKDGFTIMDGLKQSENNLVSDIVGTPLHSTKGSEEVGQAPLATGISNESFETVLDTFNNKESFQYIDNGEDTEEGVTGLEKQQSTASYVASMDELAAIDPDIDLNDCKTRRRMKKELYVSDLSTKLRDPTRTKSVYQKSQLYLGVIFLISIFYSLPVLQMVFRFSSEQRFTGNQDICYYNDLCRKPLGYIRDFNHVFSNLGYVVFGILFMCIVLFKKLKYEAFLDQNIRSIQEDEYGVPNQYGLYFAMGLALSMEGVMSSSYHVCPTNVTFQFDTTFMYLIALLMFMKLYQVRHSDVSANAVGVLFGLGVALLLETISLYYSGPFFWAFFCSVYIIVIVVVSVHAYNIGMVKYDYKILCVVLRILGRELNKVCAKQDNPETSRQQKARPRLICLLLIAFINVLLCLYFGISGTPGASNYLLIVFFLNLVLYGSYYCVMKILNGEKINIIPMIYSGLGLVSFLPAMYFFTQKEKMTEISPSLSRNMNQECIFLDFYDGHDIWHFLGAAGVFFAFLTIFTLDEDLKGKKRNTIKVF